MALPHSKAPPQARTYPRIAARSVSRREAARATPDALLGRVFNNRFRVQQLIARGGMGRVYRAVQVPLGRTVALKVLNPTFTAEQLDSFQKRFFLEAAIAARLAHANTVTVFDFGKTDDDIFYIAMEYLEGVSLRTALQRDREPGIARSLHIAMQIGHALKEAHQLGAVHRDLKPANVFLLDKGSDRDFVKVLDFGLVKQIAVDESDGITKPGKFLGSPGYMAPEQIRGQQVDARCDIYTLGVLLYEMLAGTPPFVRTGPIETMMAHVHDPVPQLCKSHPGRRIPVPLAAIVERCLEKDPNLRYAGMDALLEALAPWAAEPTFVNSRPRGARGSFEVMESDGESSGWSVVSTTGILARPQPKARHGPPPPARDVDSNADTRAMGDDVADNAETLLLDAPIASAPVTYVPPVRKKRLRRKALAVLAALAAAAVIGYAWPTATAPCTLTLRTQPSGARAFVDDALVCEQTPCEVLLEADAARRGRWLRVRFVMPGFDEFVSGRAVQPPAMDISATLDRDT